MKRAKMTSQAMMRCKIKVFIRYIEIYYLLFSFLTIK